VRCVKIALALRPLMPTPEMPTVTIAAPSLERVIALAALPPLSLYVHVPWCARKCPYCDFNSHEVRGELPERQYAQALMVDLERALPLVWGRRVHTVFFGGGTPSLLSARIVDEILSGIRARMPLDPDAEITLEANPGTLEADKFAEFRRLGINRLSIGVQSFDARHLKALGRIHDDQQARRAVEIARTHFDNVNLDLMYALPEQSLLEAEADISAAVEFGPQHISAYHLTIEPNTLFHRYPPPLPADDLAADMQDTIESLLAEHGYAHYETSAFARPGWHSRHNTNYWLFGDYLGIGAGAHSKISFADRIVRQMRLKHPREYLDRAADQPIQHENSVTSAELPFEFMMNALRLTHGVPARLFEERTGLPLLTVRRELGQAERMGLITRTHSHISPTERGQRLLNDLLGLFLREP
jgi:putative oxygen-independent coproporphyrinogen III oxidase